MATEIPEAGYQDIRDYIQNNWTYIALIGPGDVEITRIPISDERANWMHEPNAQELVYVVTVTGADAEITLPCQIIGSKLYKTASGGSAMSETTFDEYVLRGNEDSLTVRHRVQVPQIQMP